MFEGSLSLVSAVGLLSPIPWAGKCRCAEDRVTYTLLRKDLQLGWPGHLVMLSLIVLFEEAPALSNNSNCPAYESKGSPALNATQSEMLCRPVPL